jgi:hypothetical protein
MNAAECKNADLRQPTSPKRLQAPDTKIDVVDSPACDIVEEKAAPSSDGPRQTTTHVENEQGPLLGHF